MRWTVRYDTTRFYVDAAAGVLFSPFFGCLLSFFGSFFWGGGGGLFFFTKYRMIPLNCFPFTDGYPQRPEINPSRWAIPKDKNMLMSDHVKNICKN